MPSGTPFNVHVRGRSTDDVIRVLPAIARENVLVSSSEGGWTTVLEEAAELAADDAERFRVVERLSADLNTLTIGLVVDDPDLFYVTLADGGSVIGTLPVMSQGDRTRSPPTAEQRTAMISAMESLLRSGVDPQRLTQLFDPEGGRHFQQDRILAFADLLGIVVVRARLGFVNVVQGCADGASFGRRWRSVMGDALQRRHDEWKRSERDKAR